jgi:hypothetical protein
MKSLENKSGGPVALHGATVCYRREEFLAALSALWPQTWLNDDVVIPLAMRTLFPERTIRYLPTLKVEEISRKKSASSSAEFRRRRRMVVGNVQWVRFLWPAAWSAAPKSAVLATRRMFRLLWGYWLLATAAGAFTLTADIFASLQNRLPLVGYGAILLVAMLACFSSSLRRLVQSFAASLYAILPLCAPTSRDPVSIHAEGWR